MQLSLPFTTTVIKSEPSVYRVNGRITGLQNQYCRTGISYLMKDGKMPG